MKNITRRLLLKTIGGITVGSILPFYNEASEVSNGNLNTEIITQTS